MDMKRRKELLQEWKNRHPEMGVFSICCKPTGDVYLGISKDTKVGYNRHLFQLSAKQHPNKQLQELWNQYGDNGMEYSVVKELKYDDPAEDQTDALIELLEECLREMPEAKEL